MASFYALSAAVLLGALLAIPHLGGRKLPPGWLVAVHAAFGISGLAALAFALRGPPRGLDQGTGAFGLIAAVLIALALVAALGMYAMRRARGRILGALIGAHATLAVGGIVVLAAYIFS